MNTTLTIQQAAKVSGLSVHTLRYYERIGLIDPVPRQDNRHRQYRDEELRWIEFLLKLRATGMPIRQMLRYAELRRRGNDFESVFERKAMLEQHTRALEMQLDELQKTVAVMCRKIEMYNEMTLSLHPPATDEISCHPSTLSEVTANE